MKIISWNVNGLRAVHKRDFLNWFEQARADVVCLQEVKLAPHEVAGLQSMSQFLNPHGFHSEWHAAEKLGYSGLVTYSKREPEAVRTGLGIPSFDREGRWLEVDFGKKPSLTVISQTVSEIMRDFHSSLPFVRRQGCGLRSCELLVGK